MLEKVHTDGTAIAGSTTRTPQPVAKRDNGATLKKEALFFIAYSFLYIGSLTVTKEGEIAHWLSLVIVPFLIIAIWRRRRGDRLQQALASVGLRKGNLCSGLKMAFLVGIALAIFQIFMTDSSTKIQQVFASGKALYMLPISFLFFLMTAGFTEEFFFRGVLQTRISVFLRSETLGVLAASLIFGLYHLPYAYLLTEWPSHGDLLSALVEGVLFATVGGLIFGYVYVRSNHNLLASVVVHTSAMAPVVMTLVKFSS